MYNLCRILFKNSDTHRGLPICQLCQDDRTGVSEKNHSTLPNTATINHKAKTRTGMGTAGSYPEGGCQDSIVDDECHLPSHQAF